MRQGGGRLPRRCPSTLNTLGNVEQPAPPPCSPSLRQQAQQAEQVRQGGGQPLDIATRPWE